MPSAPEHYAGRLASARGDIMVLGDPGNAVRTDPATARELLVGSSWYLQDKDVQNGYSTIRFRAFTQRFCRTVNGGTCRRALSALWVTEPATGRPWADLLSVSTVVIHRPLLAGSDLHGPPAGWRVSEATPRVVVWTRDQPVPTAGGVVAASPGVAVDEAEVTDRRVAVRVARVGPQGGTLTFSRLAWPGYSARGAELTEPLAGVLVRVAVPAGAAGRTVTLEWEPPGWELELGALATAVLGGLLWVGWAARGSGNTALTSASYARRRE